MLVKIKELNKIKNSNFCYFIQYTIIYIFAKIKQLKKINII